MLKSGAGGVRLGVMARHQRRNGSAWRQWQQWRNGIIMAYGGAGVSAQWRAYNGIGISEMARRRLSAEESESEISLKIKTRQ